LVPLLASADERVLLSAVSSLHSIAYDSIEGREACVDADAPHALMELLRAGAHNDDVILHAAGALRSITHDYLPGVTALCAAGAPTTLVRLVRVTHPSQADGKPVPVTSSDVRQALAANRHISPTNCDVFDAFGGGTRVKWHYTAEVLETVTAALRSILHVRCLLPVCPETVSVCPETNRTLHRGRGTMGRARQRASLPASCPQ
jgi:hypothetical protein